MKGMKLLKTMRQLCCTRLQLSGKFFVQRLFRRDDVPRKLRPVLKQEGIIVIDEGIAGQIH